MASLEDRILYKLIKGRSLKEALKQGMTAKHFLNADSRQIFDYLYQHWHNPNTYGTLPSEGSVMRRSPVLQRVFQLFDPNHVDEADLTAQIYELKMRSFESDARGMADYFQELVQEDPVEAIKAIKAAVLDMDLRLNATSTAQGMNLNDIMTMAESHYDGAEQGTIFGIPWPWKPLTDDTLGKRGGDFVVFYGRMKSMKTWLLLYCAAYDYLVNNKRVVVWSKEMSKEKLGLRMATLLAKVDYQLFKKGLLPPRTRQRCFDILGSLVRTAGNAKMHGGGAGTRDILLLAGLEAPRNLEGLKQKVEEFEADVVYLDSFYHLDSPRSEKMTVRWQRVACVAEDVKAYAEEAGLPVVAVHQANRSGEKTYGNTLADLADADVIAREADLIIRVVPGPKDKLVDENDYEVEMAKEVRSMRRVAAVQSGALRTAKQGNSSYRIPGITVGKTDKRAVNSSLLLRMQEQLNSKRIGGSLGLVMGGNREGVLEAFIVNAIPSYNFELKDAAPDMGLIASWVKDDDKRDSSSPFKGGKKDKNEDKNYDDMLSQFDPSDPEVKDQVRAQHKAAKFGQSSRPDSGSTPAEGESQE